MSATLSAPASPAAPPAPTAFGRFALTRVLGQGAQAVVWLGFDRRLEREVAIKVMRATAAADAAAVGEWLREARSVSRLNHRSIVPVFEADVHDGQPYLVFEYVPGPTLSQHLAARGALPPHEAVALIAEVLDALDAAHGAGVVHRDLKPSNILVGADGRARVMDFGIAARLQDGGHRDEIVGTPGYMSPEATRGATPTAAMDLFSVGLMLAEALSGRRLVGDADPRRAMRRVAEEDLALPAELPAEVDDSLKALLRRALARDASQRWSRAAEFRDALRAWLAPAPVAREGPVEPEGGGPNATLDFLLRRMRHKSDFPALSDSVVRIQRVADSDDDSLDSLAGEILKDVALTKKLLRMVNTAHFRGAAGDGIGTVSRAVALVGFNGIRNMAMSLVLLEHLHDKAHANQLKEEFLRSLLAGMVASELGQGGADSEQAFIGALFQNLGRLLTEFYFPEEARQVRALLTAAAQPGHPPLNEAAASEAVLGLGFEALGLGVARAWGLPADLQRCMTRPAGEPPARAPGDAAERRRWSTRAANDLADLLLRTEPAHAAAGIAALAERFARALGTDAARITAAAEASRERLADMARAMNLQVGAASPARRLFATAGLQPPQHGQREPDSLTPYSVKATVPDAAQATVRLSTAPDAGFGAVTEPAAPCAPDDAADLLAAGVQDITRAMVEDFKLNDVLRMVLETMFRALGFRRIVFCLRDAATQSLTGRFGLGEDAAAVAAQFKVPLKQEADLFVAVCLKGADTLITDATAPRIASRLPAWYRQHIDAPAFLLLPMQLKGAPFALIYADKATPGGIALGEKELALLRTLRNQAVMAFKQAT